MKSLRVGDFDGLQAVVTSEYCAYLTYVLSEVLNLTHHWKMMRRRRLVILFIAFEPCDVHVDMLHAQDPSYCGDHVEIP